MDTGNDLVQAPSEDEARRELAALRSKRAAVEAERERKLAATEAIDELARERRALVDAEAINRAIDEHGKVGVVIEVVQTSIGAVIVKRASAMRFKRFQDGGEVTAQECERLVRPSLVHPSPEVFDLMIDEQPAIIMHAANAIARLAGIRKEDTQKK